MRDNDLPEWLTKLGCERAQLTQQEQANVKRAWQQYRLPLEWYRADGTRVFCHSQHGYLTSP